MDALRARFAATADRQAALADARADQLAEAVRRFASPGGDEHALDAGTGTGALAVALAPLVHEVVGVDAVPELLAHARRRVDEAGLANVELLEADVTRLPFAEGSFDLVGAARLLHHVPHPEYAVSELARVLRVGGHLLVLDQIAPADPLVAIELDRFERARDPTHTRLLPDGDVRALFEMNDLVLIRSRFEHEDRPLDAYLDLAGCEGDDRERARSLAPRDPYGVELGWYLAVKRPLRA
jgi:ubiquinone/menaquinone biosynthesis C-methylase UbiE